MRLPSVTRVIPSDFTGVSPAVLAAACKRGSDVHSAAASWARGVFIPSSLIAGDRAGYFNSFKEWFEQYVKTVWYVEQEFIDPVYQYVGHVDIVATLTDGRFCVIDYKTPAAVSKPWRLQLAAYKHLVELELKKKEIPHTEVNALSLRLMHDGRPAKAVEYSPELNDFPVFLSCLNVHRFFYS